MRTLRPFLFGPTLLASFTLVAAAASAQAGPGVITNFVNDAVLNSNTLSSIYATGGANRGVIQINFTKSHPSDTAGKWTLALTVYDLSSTYGGVAGGQYVIMGQYDTTGTTPTFTPSTLANNMNNTGNAPCFGLMIEGRDGLYAALDQRTGIFVSWRKDNKSAFPAPVLVTVAPSTPPLVGTYIDPALGYVDNKLKLFYIDKVNSVYMRDLTPTFTSGVLTKAELQGNGTVVATLTIRPHSPTPIIDKNGEVRGLWMAGNSGTDSDMYFMPSLNPKDTPIKLFDNTLWMNNGGVCGGKLFFANSTNYTSANVAEVAWLVGSNTALGGTATMTLGCRNSKSVAPVVSKIALSVKFNAGNTAPLPIPGWNGGFALASPMIVFTNMVGLGKDELAHWNQAVPQDNALKGLRVAVQGLALPQALPPTLTNTATLEFK